MSEVIGGKAAQLRAMEDIRREYRSTVESIQSAKKRIQDQIQNAREVYAGILEKITAIENEIARLQKLSGEFKYQREEITDYLKKLEKDQATLVFPEEEVTFEAIEKVRAEIERGAK